MTDVRGVMVVTHCVPEQAPCTQKRAMPRDVQEQVVDAARLQWPLLFSRLFEVTTFSGNGKQWGKGRR